MAPIKSPCRVAVRASEGVESRKDARGGMSESQTETMRPKRIEGLPVPDRETRYLHLTSLLRS